MSRSMLLRLSTRTVMLGCLTLFLSGCTGDMQDLYEYVGEVKSRKQGQIEPLPEIKEVETYAYVAGDRRDPFAPAVEEESDEVAASGGIMPDLTRRKEELEGYALDSLRMVGTLEQLDTTWALIKTKDNAIHRIKPGNYMGQNHGQVLRVSETEVELTELIQDGKGGYREREASLALTE